MGTMCSPMSCFSTVAISGRLQKKRAILYVFLI